MTKKQERAILNMCAELTAVSPVPWTVRAGVCRNDHPDTSADVHGAHGEFVADCGCHELANANARLIAAAPELVAALERATITLRVILGRLHDPQDDQQRASVERVRYVIEQGEVAIAKAVGK